jgi:uncharacterized protein YbjT (DUF2867 family)
VPMRIFLAGATGVIGIRVLPLLIAGGHTVAGMTRSPHKSEQLAALGARPAVCDVYDAPALTRAVTAFAPDAVVHQLTDLPDHSGELPGFAARNDRMRTEGTANLLAAAAAAGVRHFLAQSIAWRPAGRAEATDSLERQVLDAGGVVVRYGQLYGPGTYYPDELPGDPRVHVDAAARATPPLIQAPPAVVIVTDETLPRAAAR